MFIRRPHSLKLTVMENALLMKEYGPTATSVWMVSYSTDKQPGKMSWLFLMKKWLKTW